MMLNNLICAALVASQLAIGSIHPAQEPATVTDTPDYSYIIHASGEIDSHVSTNSREALRNAYLDGNRVIEIDFNFTSDNVPVCIHDWNSIVLPGINDGFAESYDSYLDRSVFGELTPMTLEDVARFMTLHDDLYVVTDVKDNNLKFCEIVKNTYPELVDRFIIQIYSEQEYAPVAGYGFDKIIFTLYKLDWETKTNPNYLVAFSRQYPLFGYTFPYELCEIEGYVETMKQAEVPLFIHTVNDKEEQQKYFDMGIDGIYTDNTINE